MLIFIHMTYMIIVREFPSHSYRAVSAVAILLFFAGRWLYRDNAPLRLTPTSDILILWLSNKALIIYITHGLVLIAIALRRGYTG